MKTPEMAAKVGKAFAMMSNTYTFDLVHEGLPEPLYRFNDVRVVAVVVHESEAPELLIFDPADNTCDYYSIDELHIVDSMQLAA